MMLSRLLNKNDPPRRESFLLSALAKKGAVIKTSVIKSIAPYGSRYFAAILGKSLKKFQRKFIQSSTKITISGA